jgi:hypothetical protein
MSLTCGVPPHIDFYKQNIDNLKCIIIGNTVTIPYLRIILLYSKQIKVYAANNAIIECNNIGSTVIIQLNYVETLNTMLNEKYNKVIQYNDVFIPGNHFTTIYGIPSKHIPFEEMRTIIRNHGDDYEKYSIKVSDIYKYFDILQYDKTKEKLQKEEVNINKSIDEFTHKLQQDERIVDKHDDFLNDKCPICLDEFYKLSDNIVTLSCGCYFCKPCITNSQNLTCPKCNRKFIKESIDSNRVIRDMVSNDNRVICYKKIKELEQKKKPLSDKPYYWEDINTIKQRVKQQFIEKYPDLNIMEIIADIFNS